MAGRLRRWQDRVRAKNREPFEPLDLVLPLVIAIALLVPLLSLPFVIERFVARDPAWLPVDRADILLSYHLFGGYVQEQYAAFVLSLLALAIVVGACAGYLLLRRFVPAMVRGAPIPNAGVWLRAVVDWYLAIPLSVGLTVLLAWVAGVREPDALYSWLLTTVVLGGYVLGSTAAKASIGVWWHFTARRVRARQATL